jgi:hypothetical protein
MTCTRGVVAALQSIDLKNFEQIQLQLIWLYMIFKMLEIISNTRVVDGHGPNSVKKGATFEVGLIMLLLKMYLIFDVGEVPGLGGTLPVISPKYL